ncbi:MAG: mycofactocin-associated electron transfer flavoprotein alpha subunit [Actinomycetota bacterium]|nr:mycofactocin-associated electron transfer flavoprotein alpha subunit [Actinomycetota bacterium]
MSNRLAVICSRAGELPLGGADAAAEAGGDSLVIGVGAERAAASLPGRVRVIEAAAFDPVAWAGALAGVIAPDGADPDNGPDHYDVVILPSSPDGRDLAPHLAAALGRPLLAGAIEVACDGAAVARHGGATIERIEVREPFVATLQPGARGVAVPASPDVVEVLDVAVAAGGRVAELIEILPADPATMDLAEAPRIIGGGAGLRAADFDGLAEIAGAIGASVGGTRVVTDAGWLPYDRQIGTTGVAVHPDLYIAIGISGAVQHTAGLGQPRHIVSVNTDPSCPMMALADLAIVTDGPELVDALVRLLASDTGGGTDTVVAPATDEGANHA